MGGKKGGVCYVTPFPGFGRLSVLADIVSSRTGLRDERLAYFLT